MESSHLVVYTLMFDKLLHPQSPSCAIEFGMVDEYIVLCYSVCVR